MPCLFVVCTLSCASLFRPLSLHFLKMQGGFSFHYLHLMVGIKINYSCGDHSSCCRVDTWPLARSTWYSAAVFSIVRRFTFTDKQHWMRSGSLWMDPSEPGSIHQYGTGRSVQIRQAPTLGPRMIRSLSHLPQVNDVGFSVPRVELAKNTGVETLLAALRRSGLVRKVPTAVAAKLRDMLGLVQRVSRQLESDSTSVIEGCPGTEAPGQHTGCR